MSDSNSIFNYFSYYYLNKIDIKKMFRIEDELIVARLVMKELYKFANREIPEYFPERPVEEKYNKNLEKWQKSIKLRKVDIKYTNGSVYAYFPLDMKNEMRPHLKALPQELVSEMHGDMIISNRVAEFKHWLRSANTKKGLWERLFGN